jgi:hypothetical protein
MILYHFTDPAYLENKGTILKEGLKPAFDGENQPHEVVWLTELDGPIWRIGAYACDCRIKLFIPITDKRLVRWERWLIDNDEQARLAEFATLEIVAWKQFWCYFGTVPPSAFRAIEGCQ